MVQVPLEERLSRLHSLHLEGGLTASEFAVAKRQVLQQPPSAHLPTRGQPFLVTLFGAAGDGIRDDTRAIQAAVDAALAPGGPALVIFPPGEFIISDTINATGSEDNMSFSPCSFAGQSIPQRSVLQMASQSGGASAEKPRPLIRFRGGSGGISHAFVERLTLAGEDAAGHFAGIHFSGMDGVTARQCVFSNLTIGAWFFNQDAGGFTEYCQVHDSQFTATVLTALKYQRSPPCPTSVYPCKTHAPCDGSCNASGSFHGSGMLRCTANWAGKAPFIHVASPGVVYNAPWDFQVWYTVAEPLIVITNDTYKVWPFRAMVLTHGA